MLFLSPFIHRWFSYVQGLYSEVTHGEKKLRHLMASYGLFHKGKRSAAIAFSILILQCSVIYSSTAIVSFIFNLPI